MEQRRLGRGAVGAVGLGAMSFAGVYGPTTEEVSHATLAAMLDLGMNHVDTSNIYGMGVSEEVIGRFLARQGRARDGRFHIATKAGIRVDRAAGRRWIDNSAAHLTEELEGSLRRLGVEAVDLFYVHRRDRDIPIEDVAGTLAGLVAAGKARSFGFSEIAPSSLRRAAAEHAVAAVQSEYSLSTRAPELGLVQACEELGTALVAFSPVGRGLLTDTPADAERVAASDFLRGNPRFIAGNLERNVAATEGFRRLAAEMETTAAALSIAWLLARSPGVVPIPGTRSPEHLRELAAGAALELDAADLARIEAALPVGWCHGDRYSDDQWKGPERFS
jgi:aryl-alcohol dehydrogenase-like predicted oxidoreductase